MVLTVLLVLQHYIGSLIIVPTLPCLVSSQTWQYQGQTEKVTVPILFSHILPQNMIG